MKNKLQEEDKGPVLIIGLEFLESLHTLASTGENAEDVEANSFRQRPALTDGNLITLLDTESWGNVCRDVLMTLLITLVLRDVVQVVAADDKGSVHFC